MAQAMQVDLNEEVQVVEQPQARTLTPPTLKRKRSKNARQSVDAEVRPRDGRALPALSDEEEWAVEGLRPTVEEAPPSPFEMRNRRMALKAVSSTVETLVNSGEAQKFLEHAWRDRKRMRIEDAPPPPQPQPQVIVRPGVIVRPEAIVPRSLCGPGPYLGPYSAVI